MTYGNIWLKWDLFVLHRFFSSFFCSRTYIVVEGKKKEESERKKKGFFDICWLKYFPEKSSQKSF